MKYILASASPRRKELLRLYIPDFEIIPSDADETFRPHEPVEDELTRITKLKASSAAVCHPDAVVISADTIVQKDGIIYGKPKNADDAANTLRRLRGQTHKVLTCVCVMQPGGWFTFTEETSVTFRNYGNEIIEWYISTGEPFDRAGAYAVQGYGALLVSKIDGDYNNVVGLPVVRLIYEMRERNLFEFSAK